MINRINALKDLITINVRNICNLIGREEYNIGRIVLSTSIFLYSTKKQQQ